MSGINSMGRGQVQLESLDSMRANNLQSQPQNQGYDTNPSGLQSLDSLRANNYTDPNGGIPTNDVLAPIDAITPEIPGQDKQDTKEHGAGGFIGGVFKGFGKAGLDTVKGVFTLGKVTVAAVTHPKDAAKYVGGGISYAVSHPVSALKTVAIDLPVGIVKGIVNPYAEAIKTGQYGQAVGRGVFDVGLVLLTAGLGDGTQNGAAQVGSEAGVESVSKGSKAAKAALESVTPASETGAGIVAKSSVKGGIKIGTNAVHDVIKASGKSKVVINGDVIINVGGNVVKNSGSAGRVAAETGQAITGATEAVASTSRVAGVATATTEAVAGSGKIAIGLGDLGGALARGAKRIGGLFKPVGQSMGGAVGSIIGADNAAAVGNVVRTIGKGIGVGGQYVKEGALFVKAHPLPSALIAGKTVDIIDKGLKSTDNYDPGNIDQ